MKKKNRIIKPQDFFQLLSNKTLLLDASFFADYAVYPEAFLDFANECKNNGITFVTITPVIAEFTKGSKDTSALALKTAMIKKIIGNYILPIPADVFKAEIPWLVEQYGEMGKSVSITDFILAGMTKKYKIDFCFLTKNPRDFPNSIFTLKSYFLLELERPLQVYCAYCYKDPTTVKDADSQEDVIAPF